MASPPGVGRIPPLTYLSMDAISDGIGLSQVTRYVERLGRRGLDVTLHSYEHRPPDPDVAARLTAAGVRWRPHRFRVAGAPGGALRVAHGAALVVRAPFVHARSDLAAASSLIAGRRTWVWDLRAFWREQRIDTGILAAGSPQERALRAVERRSAAACTGIVTLTRAAVDVLAERYGDEVAAKARVIPTCVDLDVFAMAPWPDPPLKLLLSGTLSAIYDVPAMLGLVDVLRQRVAAELTVLTPGSTVWDDEFARLGIAVEELPPAAMPSAVQAHHVGLSIIRSVGVSTRAMAPTKLGEFLAAGRPVVVNAGLGDMDQLLSSYDCGVVVGGANRPSLEQAADEVLRLVADAGTPARCRKLAEEHFDLERGVDELVGLYGEACR